MFTLGRVAGGWFVGRRTETAGTAINVLIPSRLGSRTLLKRISYTAAGTAHTLTLFRPLGVTTLSADAAGGQPVVNLDSDPGDYSAYGSVSVSNNPIAANDWVAYRIADGRVVLAQVSSVSGLAVTLTSNVPSCGARRGTRFWFFGVASDVNPATGSAHDTLLAPASATTTYTDDWGFVSSVPPLLGPSLTKTWPLTGFDEPILLQSNNITAAGSFDFVVANYISN